MDLVFSVATAVQLGTALPAGWIYDRFGGRAASLGGALMAAVGLLFMSAACYWPASLSWLLFIGYPVAMLGGMINSYGIFAFIWLLPNDQNFISSMVGGAQALSDMLALVAVALSSCCSFFVGDFFLLLAFLSVLAGLVCWLLVPSRDVVNALAIAAIADQAPGSSASESDRHGGDHADRAQHQDAGCLSREMHSMKESWQIMKRFAGANLWLCAFSTVYILAMYYPMQQMYFYYTLLFQDESTATTLVNVYAFIYGIGGFVSSLAGGKACDRLGIERFTIAVAACAVIMALILPIENFALQVAAQLIMTVGFQLYSIIVNRFAMLYAPPHLFGAFSGVQFSFISVGMVIGMAAVGAGMDAVNAHGVLKYQIPYVGLGVGAMFLGIGIVGFWRQHPPPPLGGSEPIA